MKENKFQKQFLSFEQKSNEALSMFEVSIQRLKGQNDQLAQLHGNVEAEIENLTQLKYEIAERIATNENAINSLNDLIGKVK